MFLGAVRVDWLHSWICVAPWTISRTTVGLLIARSNPQLMKQRAKWRPTDTVLARKNDGMLLIQY